MRLSSRSSGDAAPTGGVTPPFTATPPAGGFTGVVTSTVVLVTVALVLGVVAMGDVSCLGTDLELNVQVVKSK